MSRITLYLIKELTSSFLFVAIILTSIAWLSQGLRYLELFTSENISASEYIYYIMLLLPKLITLTIPISLFISLIFTLNRMRSDSELIIYWASGKSNRDILLKPILSFSFIFFLIQFFLTTYLVPLSSLELRNKITEIRSGGIEYSVLKEKKFINPVKNLTIFIQNIENELILGLLIQDNEDQYKPITYIAESGLFNYKGSESSIQLRNGMMQIFNKKEMKINEVEFDTYELDLSAYYNEEIKYIYPDERSTLELINKIIANVYTNQDFGILNNRFISPFYIFVISILPLLAFKIIRRPDYRWTKPILLISFIAILIKFYEIALSNIFIENISYIYIAYASPILMFIFFNLILFYDNDILKKLRIR